MNARLLSGAPDKKLTSNRLSLKDALELARTNSAELTAQRAELEAGRANALAASSIDNPELRVGNLRLDRLVYDRAEVDVRLRVKPPRPLENAARIAEAQAEARALEADLQRTEREISAGVRLAYAEASTAIRAVAAAAELVALEKKVTSVLAVALGENRTTSLEIARARVDAAASDAELAALVAERTGSLGHLGDQLGATIPEDIDLETVDIDTIESVEFPAEPALVVMAMKQAPALERRLAEIDAAAARVDIERSRQWPWFSFVDLGYDFSTDTDNPLGFTFGAGVTLPVFDTNAAKVDAAKARQVASESRLGADAQALRDSVRNALREASAAATALVLHRTSQRPAAQSAIFEAEKALGVGGIDELGVLRLKIQSAQLNLAETKPLRRLLMALSELERLTGWKPSSQ